MVATDRRDEAPQVGSEVTRSFLRVAPTLQRRSVTSLQQRLAVMSERERYGGVKVSMLDLSMKLHQDVSQREQDTERCV